MGLALSPAQMLLAKPVASHLKRACVTWWWLDVASLFEFPWGRSTRQGYANASWTPPSGGLVPHLLSFLAPDGEIKMPYCAEAFQRLVISGQMPLWGRPDGELVRVSYGDYGSCCEVPGLVVTMSSEWLGFINRCLSLGDKLNMPCIGGCFLKGCDDPLSLRWLWLTTNHGSQGCYCPGNCP